MRCLERMGNTQKIMCLTGLGLLAAFIYAINFDLPTFLAKFHLLPSIKDGYSSYLLQLAPLTAFYLVALRIVFHPAAEKEPAYHYQPLMVILFFALLFRVLLLPAAPVLSTDIYRYIWDGRVQAHGINPYLYAPHNEALKALRDQAIYPFINRLDSPTIYPAGAQILFHVLNRLGIQGLVAFKAAVSAFDMGSIYVLILILMRLKLPIERVLVYAWHPLVIYELAGNGHLDGVMLFFVLLALLFMLQRRQMISVCCLCLATSLKLYPVILLPALIWKRKFRACMLFGLLFLLLYLPYLSAGGKILGFLPEYFNNPHESYNLGLRAYLLQIFPAVNPMLVTTLMSGLLLAAAAVVWFLPKNTMSALWYAFTLTGLLFVFATGSLQPWYLVLIIPFLAVFHSPAWLYFSFAVCLSYLTFLSPDFEAPEWVRAVEYLPLFILLSVEYISFFIFSRGRPAWDSDYESMRHHPGI